MNVVIRVKLRRLGLNSYRTLIHTIFVIASFVQVTSKNFDYTEARAILRPLVGIAYISCCCQGCLKKKNTQD